ncbi:hypothetical protein BGZ65_010699 [Modicella reniformis]|uniref:FAD-binding domain-containing protein n=1 Tax=Modicella reniformis TaxID=1440133 RepID=A0A9P6MK51_9FUNG|nr:hypothetical protein BGZ65_010699 [Modicella reniformis]
MASAASSSSTKSSSSSSSHSITKSSIPVLIAGAGPVGLFEAYLLTKLGIPVRIVERELAISPLSKALGLQPRSMEIMQITGLIDKFLARGQPLYNFNFYFGTKHMATMPLLSSNTRDTHYGYGLFMEQAITSEILVEELKTMGVKVDHGWELLDTKVVEEEEEVHQDFIGSENKKQRKTFVETTIRRALSGDNTTKDEQLILGGVDPFAEQPGKAYETQVVRSDYLVAADGGRSTVRHKLNIAFPGETLKFKTMMWDGTFECDLKFKEVMFVNGNNRKTMVAFPLTNGSTRIAFEAGEMQPDEDFAETIKDLTIEKFEEGASAIIGTPFKIKTTEWLTMFKVNERRAEHFVYKNRVFLAGDAAHVHSPSGGQGMNTGIMDAHNLAWKLALVINGLASESLLETYEEREAMADRAIKLSHKLLVKSRKNNFLSMLIKRIYYTMGPLINKMMRFFSGPPEVAMLKVRYHENTINKPHATQPIPSNDDYRVGVRAQDGSLYPTMSTNDEKNEITTLRLHELTAGIGRFHILVFTSDMLALNNSEPRSINGIKTTNVKALESNIDSHIRQWRSKWSYASAMHDGYDDKDLFKIHIIAGSLSIGQDSNDNSESLDQLIRKQKGDGKAFLDESEELHQKYGFAWKKGHGGIVVIRPDSHIGYRVNGTGDQAWKDVEEYLSSFLAA